MTSAASPPRARCDRSEAPGSSAEKKYESYIAGRETKFASALRSAVPSARLGRSLTTVYGGVAMSLPANQVAALLRVPGVVAVQSGRAATSRSPTPARRSSAPRPSGRSWAAQANAGKGVIFGDLDTGVWPEHPSFADNGNLAAPAGQGRRHRARPATSVTTR